MISRSANNSIVNLNVGGARFTTSLTTVTREPESMLARMFSDDWRNKLDASSEYFIDRDGHYFRYILNYLRDGPAAYIPNDEATLHELRREAQFYQLSGLTTILNQPIDTPIVCDATVRWRSEAIEDYLRSMATVLFTKNSNMFGVMLPSKIDGNFGDQAYVWCMGCDRRKRIDLHIAYQDEDVRRYLQDSDISHFSLVDVAAVKSRMTMGRYVVSEIIGNTCAIITLPLSVETFVVPLNSKRPMKSNEMKLHVPLNAIIAA